LLVWGAASKTHFLSSSGGPVVIFQPLIQKYNLANSRNII